MNSLISTVYAEATPVTGFEKLVTIKSAGDQTIGGLMTLVVGWISIIVGILAFIYLIYAGITYITAAGNPDQAKKGQQGIINAIIGIIICIFAYTIVKVVANKVGGVAGS